ncbi:transposase [Paenirhodobacter populi]|uniref:transposase n=1 Tax=Paenirhodobacter populi TaxID=2306993 RepID=UPI000FE3FD7B|nr:transposase [Sinirhodobacter populi]RWR07665.1 transposase [Sinirhodobacter populi]
MTRRKFSRELKIDAVRLVTDRGVVVTESVLRRWMRGRTSAPVAAFPGNGRMRADLAEMQRLRKTKRSCATGSSNGAKASLRSEHDIMRQRPKKSWTLLLSERITRMKRINNWLHGFAPTHLPTPRLRRKAAELVVIYVTCNGYPDIAPILKAIIQSLIEREQESKSGQHYTTRCVAAIAGLRADVAWRPRRCACQGTTCR